MSSVSGSAAETARYRTEFLDTLKLAWPMALTQLGQVGMLTTDVLMIGRLGEGPLAAAALGHTVFFAAFILGMGLVWAVAPLASQAYGAQEPRMMRRSLRAGLQVSVLLGVPLSIVMLWSEPLLRALGQEPENARLAARYLQGLAWCFVPGWMFIALRGFMGALNRPEPALWIMLAAVPLNALLAYGLIHGLYGLPRLDILGAGVATTVVNALMCLAAGALIFWTRPFQRYHAFGYFWRADWTVMKQMLLVGLPISGAFQLEFGVFGAVALLMGTISTAALAAHQIALQIAALVFMIPFGISMAATVRVGHAVGRQDGMAARRAGLTALALTAVATVVMALAVVVFRFQIPQLFFGAAAPGAEATVVLAASLLLWGASFAMSDGLQTVAAGALRGLNDTAVPMLIAVLSYWGVGFLCGYGLAFWMGYGAHGLWAGLAAGLTVHAVLLSWRFERMTRGGRLPPIAVVNPQQ